jgi:mRNA interferase MazF
MRRGELYLVRKPGSKGGSGDPKRQRVFAVVSRQVLIDSKFSTVICAPVYSRHDGLSTQVRLGTEDGLKHESSIHCDGLVSLPKAALTNLVGSIDPTKIRALNLAVATAIGLDDATLND